MVNLSELDINFYHYHPSIGGSVAFLLVFFGLTFAHAFYASRTGRKRYIPLVVGGLCEAIAYCIRAGAHDYLTKIGPYIFQNLCLLLPPVFFAATIYMVLGDIIRTLRAEEVSPINPSRLTKIFVSGDIACLFIQGNGGSMQAIHLDNSNFDLQALGKWVTVGGLMLQILIFGLFVWVTRKTHLRITQHPTMQPHDHSVRWEQCMVVLYSTSALIVLRNTVRTIEYCQGFEGWIIRHEVMLFLFDGVPMGALMVILLIWYPPHLLGGGHQSNRVALDDVELRMRK